MFDLEKSIADWRKQMRAAGIKASMPLEELEIHLREEISHFVASGKSEAVAFEIAVTRVGNPGTVGSEFRKNNSQVSRSGLIGLTIWLVAAAVLLIIILNQRAHAKWNPLLAAHIFSVTMGYAAAFLAGGFGIYGICSQRLRASIARDGHNLNRTIHFFTVLAAVVAGAGFVLGMLWSRQNLGGAWTNDPREIGNLCAVIWLVTTASMQRFARLSHYSILRWSIAGNMVVGLGWFGSWLMAHGQTITSFWLLDVLLGLHLFFLGMSATRSPKSIEA
jgi:hypothetical protein